MAKKSKTDKTPGIVQYFRSAAVASTLLSVATMMFLPDYFYWFVVLVYGAIVIWTADLFYTFRGKGLTTKAAILIAGLAILLAFTFGFVWIKAPLPFMVHRNEFPYSAAEVGGVKWSDKFNELRIIFDNPTAYDYQDIDIIIKVDQPVVDIGQVTKLPGVTFLDAADMRVSMVEMGGKRVGALSLMPVASITGHRVRADRLPKKSSLEIIMANANVNGSFPDILDIKMSNGDRYWYVNKEHLRGRSVDDLYLSDKPRVRLVNIEGEYTVLQRRMNIKRALKIK